MYALLHLSMGLVMRNRHTALGSSAFTRRPEHDLRPASGQMMRNSAKLGGVIVVQEKDGLHALLSTYGSAPARQRHSLSAPGTHRRAGPTAVSKDIQGRSGFQSG